MGLQEPDNSWTVVERLDQSRATKIDLLLAIDNSRSMADKQAILANAVPDLVESLINPPCLDQNGAPLAKKEQPHGPAEACPKGSGREFEPILDVHIGIISSSLGGHGGTICADQNDQGHLLSRKDPSPGAEQIPTYAGKGFLAWDPDKQLSPPGESEIGSLDDQTPGLIPTLADMVKGVGQTGCGFESQLESVYRFLVDPEPYASIKISGETINRVGKDDALLAARRDFLRPDSLVAIVMLTDENDCSVNESGDNYRLAESKHLARPRAICADKPNDACCVPCDVPVPAGCAVDATCFDDKGAVRLLDKGEDNINLRCFDQKRRFGKDFLYPTQRYIDAFSQSKLLGANNKTIDNPLFVQTNPSDGSLIERPGGLVFFAGIVGVPWQDIAKDPHDLKKGLKTSDEMAKDQTWSWLLGDAASGGVPVDPLMRESVAPRSGKNPALDEALDVDPLTPNNNSINGQEWNTQGADLQYACIFDVPTTTDCSNDASCECNDPASANPLCDEKDPQNRIRAKAQPGTRQLEVLRGLGNQGVVGSVCPSQVNDRDAADYGYRPAIGAIIAQLKTVIGEQCLPRVLETDEEDQVNCVVFEAKHTGGSCSCDKSEARLPMTETRRSVITQVKDQNPDNNWDCFCEIPQLKGDARDTCQSVPGNNPQSASGEPVDGFCYVDATTDPPVGNENLVARCPTNEKRMLRLVGKGEPSFGSTVFMACGSR